MVGQCVVCGVWVYCPWRSRADTYPNGRLLEARRDADDLLAFCSEDHRDQYDTEHNITR